jgi:hypothetical protein
MGSLLLIILVAVAITAVAALFFGRGGRTPEDRAEAGRPEDYGTSYEEPQDEGPIQHP